MIRIYADTSLNFQLVMESLTNHGFKATSEIRRRWRFFGKKLYIIDVEFIPGELFLNKLLEEFIKDEDYWGADSVQRMINIRKNQ